MSKLPVWIVIAAAVGGCGSTAPQSGTSTNVVSATAIRFSQCMRGNGVPNFPDAGPGGYGRRGVNLGSPAVARAMHTCQRYLPPSGPPPAVPASVRHQEVLLATCMRAHGVPHFPDPNASGNIQFPVNDPMLQTPAFQKAQSECRP